MNDLTVVSPSLDRKRRLFEFTLQTSDDEQRVVYLNPWKHKLLSKIHQAETGSELKRYKLNDKNDIIVNGNTILKKVKSTFERQQKQRTFVLITYINNEAQLYERFNVVGLVVKGTLMQIWKSANMFVFI